MKCIINLRYHNHIIILIDCNKQLPLTYFANNSAYKNFVLNISCCNNCLYNLYKSANIKKDLDLLEKKLYYIIMRYLLYYLKMNKWHRHQENIKIAKKIDICTIKLAVKKSQIANKYNLASQINIAAIKVVIFKQKMEDYNKICKKTPNRFAIETFAKWYGQHYISI